MGSSTFYSCIQPFSPPIWLSNPHVQTILPKLLIKKSPDYRRVLVQDSYDSNQVAYDFYDATNQQKNTEGKYTTPIVVLFHGLEGGSDSHYAITLAHQVHAKGWHFVVPHYRSCGGVPVKGDIFYNAGDTHEVHHVLTVLAKEYETIYALGVSLGGNMLAKYMGEYKDKAVCEKAVVASAPVDLASSSIAMKRPVATYVYTPYLLKPLVKKALSTQLSPEEVKQILASKYVDDFDHIFTASRYGYRSANDYYRQSSALPFLMDICKPTLIVSAKDDPFLGRTASQGDVSEAVTLMETEHGGHIGFVQYVANAKGKEKLSLNWLADTALVFFQKG